MGRKKIIKSPEEIAAQQERWFGESRNARRRARRQADPAWAEKQRESRRRSYRRSAAPAGIEPAARIDEIGAICAMREVFDVITGRSLGVQLCCTRLEVAELLGNNPQSLANWVQTGRYPVPGFFFMREGWTGKPKHWVKQKQAVYLCAEVRAIATVLARHFAQLAHYRVDHVETREQVMMVAGQARRQALNVTREDEPRPAQMPPGSGRFRVRPRPSSLEPSTDRRVAGRRVDEEQMA